jgi:imidazole glycerol phosphate synthase subunit HisF
MAKVIDLGGSCCPTLAIDGCFDAASVIVKDALSTAETVPEADCVCAASCTVTFTLCVAGGTAHAADIRITLNIAARKKRVSFFIFNSSQKF